MSRYRSRRRLASLTARDIDEMRERHDLAELDRHLAEEEAREPADDPQVDPDFRAWLTRVDPDDFAA